MGTELICLAVAAIGGLLLSRLTKLLNLPAVTAYLVAGLLLGPYCIGALGISGVGFETMEQVEAQSILTQTALGFIAFSMGNEFRLAQLKHMGKKAIFIGDKKNKQTSIWLFIFVITATYLFTLFFNVDYGFAGVLTPVFASLFDFRSTDAPQRLKKLDNIYIRVLSMGVALVILAFSMEAMQFYSLLAIPLLMLYSEKRGRLNLKYFFYVFYPVHILVLEGISYILV